MADEAKKVMVPRYQKIFAKLDNKDKEFTEEEVHSMKVMCQEFLVAMPRHLVVKTQVDGTVSQKHASRFLGIAFENIKEMYAVRISKIIDKLKAIDRIPGDGMQGPTRMRFKVE